MRPIDLAREHGLSAQAIRNYDDAGILPPTERSTYGYRRYTPVHAQALRTFLALRGGHGTSGPRKSCGQPTRATPSPPTA